MDSTCSDCGSRIVEEDGRCPACLLLGALSDPEKESNADGIGKWVGDYEIVRRIGMGGTADVYLARQGKPIEREVALKLIRPGMNSARVVARFEAERDVLARLQHPHIATIFDTGQTSSGLPYFVLEYVEGLPVSDFAAHAQLSLKQRLQLVLQICDAVTYAHQRGVVHRDLKPSNLLVDSKGQSKVIDFGIARALEEGFGEHTLFLTRDGEVLGTPAYMSPEQALGQTAEVDTRSDVFSLGVVLYELLTGQLPVDIDQLRGASSTELRRILTETPFQRPSLRETTTTQIPVGTIRGDLDWIVMKALEQDKEQRYGSVEALAKDIERHIGNEPVSAGPPTVGYRLRKFVRRNRGVVVGSAVAAIALVAGTGISVHQAFRASAAEKEALAEAARAKSAQEEATAQAEIAQTERETSKAINDFFVGDLLGADLRNTVRSDVTVRELVEIAEGKVAARFRDQPKVARGVEMAIGDVYFALGEYEMAGASYKRAHDYNRLLDEDSAKAKQELGILRRLAYNAARQGRYTQAGEYWDQWDTVARQVLFLRKDYLYAKAERASAIATQGLPMEAIKKLKALVPEFEEHFGVDAKETLTLKRELGGHLVSVRDSDAGLPLIEEYVEKSRPAGNTLQLSEALGSLGLEYASLGRIEESQQAFKEAIAIEDEIWEPDHPNRNVTRLKLASSYKETGQVALAEASYREIFEIGMESGRALPVESLVAGLNYGMVIARTAQERAKPVFERVLQGLEELGTNQGSLWFQAKFQLAILQWQSDEQDGAISALNEMVGKKIEFGGESDPEVQGMRKVLFQLELERGRPEAALPYIRAMLTAPLPEDEHLRKTVMGTIEAALVSVEVAYADQPELAIEIYLQVLAKGFAGEEVWRGLGMALFERYSESDSLRDLRLSVICILKAVKVSDANGIKIVREWIRKDRLAEGLQAPRLLIDSKAVWHYQETIPTDSAWRRGGFDAGGWLTGQGEFGYGEGDEDTRLGFGESSGKRSMGACFRIELTTQETYERPLVGSVAFDNGTVVYVNGEEVYRALLPQGDPGPNTPATGTEVHESLLHGFAIAPELVKPGHPIVIAVQVHQFPADTDDLSFALSVGEPMPTFKEALERLPKEELESFFGEVLGAPIDS